MKLNMKFVVLGAALLMTLPSLGSVPAQAAAAKSKTAVVKSKAMPKGTVPRSINAGALNKAGSHVARPQAKGGKHSRDLTFLLDCDNYTSLYLNVWVDGNYYGQVGPYGDLYVNCEAGLHQIHCEAPGTMLVWNYVVNWTVGSYDLHIE